MLVAKTISKKHILITTYFVRPVVGSNEVKAIACPQSHCTSVWAMHMFGSTYLAELDFLLCILQHIIQRCKKSHFSSGLKWRMWCTSFYLLFFTEL